MNLETGALKTSQAEIFFWCILRSITFVAVGSYFCISSYFYLDFPLGIFACLPLQITGLVAILFGIGQWGRWKYLWVLGWLSLSWLMFLWVHNFIGNDDISGFWWFDCLIGVGSFDHPGPGLTFLHCPPVL